MKESWVHPGYAGHYAFPGESRLHLGELLARTPWGLVGWLMLLVLWITWTPAGTTQPVVRVAPPRRPEEILGNLILFAPVAFVITAAARGTSRRRIVLWSAAGAALLSAAVELGQLRVGGRVASPYDLVLNTAGAGLGAQTAWWLRERGHAGTRLLMGMGVAVFACVALFVSIQGIAASRMLRIAGWDAGFGVAAGDEIGAHRGQRAYAGSVWDARICAGEPAGRVCAPPGADAATRRGLTEAAERSQRIELTAKVLSESDLQDGPTRIVTFSRDGVRRNAMLGQSSQSLVLRVRTPLMGLNGSDIEFHLPGAIRTGGPTEVTASYAPGLTRLRAEGEGAVVDGSFPTGFLTGWRMFVDSSNDRIMVPATLHGAGAMAAAALFLPLGLASGWRGRALPAMALLAAGSAMSILLAIEFALSNAPMPSQLGMAAGFAALGAVLGRDDSRRCRNVREYVLPRAGIPA